jgi:trans-feruloyl-CoA hydratase/vanillin synthase
MLQKHSTRGETPSLVHHFQERRPCAHSTLEDTAVYETILLDIEENIATVTLNRPQKRNAMSPQLHRDMTAVLDDLRYDDDVHVLVITGSEPAFCAGMDLDEFFTQQADKPAEMDRSLRMAVEWRTRTLKYFPKPVIAMVNGYCFGGAFSILEGSDIVVAAEEATFGLSEINFRVFPGGSVSKSLADLVNPRDALYYGLTGKPFKGKEAAAMKLATYAVPKAELHDNVRELARSLATKEPSAIRATKEAFRHSVHMEWEAAMSYAVVRAEALDAEQKGVWIKEGIGDFLDKQYKPGLEAHTSKRDR